MALGVNSHRAPPTQVLPVDLSGVLSASPSLISSLQSAFLPAKAAPSLPSGPVFPPSSSTQSLFVVVVLMEAIIELKQIKSLLAALLRELTEREFCLCQGAQGIKTENSLLPGFVLHIYGGRCWKSPFS